MAKLHSANAMNNRYRLRPMAMLLLHCLKMGGGLASSTSENQKANDSSIRCNRHQTLFSPKNRYLCTKISTKLAKKWNVRKWASFFNIGTKWWWYQVLCYMYLYSNSKRDTTASGSSTSIGKRFTTELEKEEIRM